MKKKDLAADFSVHNFLLTLHNTSLAFFLASYHVHEKAILFPAIPIALLHPFLPILSRNFALFSVWSMWPLLFRDGLQWYAVGGALAYLLLLSYSTASSSSPQLDDESSFLCMGLRILGVNIKHSTVSSWLRILHAGLLFLVVALTSAVALLPPPPSLPFLHAKITSTLCALVFLLHLMCGTLVQLGWIGRSEWKGLQQPGATASAGLSPKCEEVSGPAGKPKQGGKYKSNIRASSAIRKR